MKVTFLKKPLIKSYEDDDILNISKSFDKKTQLFFSEQILQK